MSPLSSKLRLEDGEMTGARLIVVDWMPNAARAGVFSKTVRGWQLTSELEMPPRLVVRNETSHGLRVLAGAQAAEVVEDANTLVFEHPACDLPNIDDQELATLLVDGFWRAVSQGLVTSKSVQTSELIPGYVVTPQRFPLPLLESFRETCAKQRPLKLIGSIHEAAALVVGSLRVEAFDLGETAIESVVTVCLVVACDEQTIEVACFDYTQPTPTHHRILIRDCFQTTCVGLSKRLHDCDWLGAFSLLAIVEDPSLPSAARDALNTPLQAITNSATVQRRQLAAASRLRLLGGAHIALCAARQAPDDQEYDVAHAYHIGVQIDQQHFKPILNKDAWEQLGESPYLAAQGFRMRGVAGSGLRLNLYSGYSTRVAEAVPLGHTMLWQEDLAQLNARTALTAAVRLDAPGSGEFLVGVMPENRILRRHAFNVPGLVV